MARTCRCRAYITGRGAAELGRTTGRAFRAWFLDARHIWRGCDAHHGLYAPDDGYALTLCRRLVENAPLAALRC